MVNSYLKSHHKEIKCRSVDSNSRKQSSQIGNSSYMFF